METQRSSKRGCLIPALMLIIILVFIPIGMEIGQRKSDLTPVQTSPLRASPLSPTHQPTAWFHHPIGPGLHLVFVETDPKLNIITLWIAPVNHLSFPQKIAILNHQAGHPVTGQVSPDGQQIALLQSQASSASRETGRLWLVQSDGSQPRLATSLANSLGMWSPDSRRFIFGRLRDPLVRSAVDLWQLDLSKSEPALAISAEMDSDLRPLGWSPDDGRFYAASVSREGQWSILRWDPSSGKVDRQIALPLDLGVQNVSLSPPGSQLLIEQKQSGRALLTLSSLNGADRQPLSALSASTSAAPFISLWSPDGRQILLNHLPGSSPDQFERLDLATRRSIPLALDPAAPLQDLVPIAWSPDGKWLALRASGASDSDLYINALDTGKLAAFPRSDPANQVDFLGWVLPAP